jgi:hypothetical protein
MLDAEFYGLRPSLFERDFGPCKVIIQMAIFGQMGCGYFFLL